MTKKKETLEPATKKEAPIKSVAKKAATKKKSIVDMMQSLNNVELESYSMEMTIPTGQYANIRPKITVKAYSMDKAHDFIAPHMNKLWKEYYLINERRTEPAKVASTPAIPTGMITQTGSISANLSGKILIPETNNTTAPTEAGSFTYLTDTKPAPADTKPMTFEEIVDLVGGKEVSATFPNDVPAPASSVAYNKATQAIESCMSLDALEIIRAQIDKSVKLILDDKEKLQPLLMERFEKLSNGL
jgi:hypothetical protein